MRETQIIKNHIPGYTISTIWLPDMRQYETMAFRVSPTLRYWEDVTSERHDNIEDAIHAHHLIVASMRVANEYDLRYGEPTS